MELELALFSAFHFHFRTECIFTKQKCTKLLKCLYLQEGGKTKILFFIGQDSGRPKQDDVTTMNLVLEAAPEIKNHYGVILPKIRQKTAKILKISPDAWTYFFAGLFAGKF